MRAVEEVGTTVSELLPRGDYQPAKLRHRRRIGCAR